ncbi:MAG: hypothetical protein ACFFCW_41280 [Candidatus Hodarchaeota archaeon]
MAKNDAGNERILPDLLKMENEYLFKILGSEDGKYSLELKCLFLVLVLYVPGLVTSILAGTGEMFVIEGWRHLAATVLMAIVVWFLVRFLKRLDERIQHVSRIIAPVDKKMSTKEGNETWRNWNKLKKYKNWACSIGSYRAYYLYAIVGVAGGFLLGILVIKPEMGWVHSNLLNELYLRAWYIFLGFLTTVFLFYVFAGFLVIRKYCEEVVSYKEILPLDPDLTGGLRELGRISLDLDLIVALPSIAFPLNLIGRGPEFWQTGNLAPWIGLSVLYALILIFVFFVSISPTHDDMVTAKTNYLLKIHREYKDMHKEILRKLKPDELLDLKEYRRLSGLYELYDRVERMAVWPLDFRTTLRFAITSTLPLISLGITISI